MNPFNTIFEITPERIEDLAEAGLNRREIAKEIGCSYSLIRRKLNDKLSLQEAYNRGEVKFIARILNSQAGSPRSIEKVLA